MNLNRELTRPALIRGRGHERICIVSTFKKRIPPASDWTQLFATPIKVLDSDDFEDGVYELVLGAQVFALIKNGGGYKEITCIRSKAAILAS